MSKTKTKVDPEKWYTLSDLVKQCLFPWCGNDIRRYRRVIQTDLQDKNHLKTFMMGRGRTTRYRMKGASIISFIQRVEAGEIHL